MGTKEKLALSREELEKKFAEVKKFDSYFGDSVWDHICLVETLKELRQLDKEYCGLLAELYNETL